MATRAVVAAIQPALEAPSERGIGVAEWSLAFPAPIHERNIIHRDIKPRVACWLSAVNALLKMIMLGLHDKSMNVGLKVNRSVG